MSATSEQLNSNIKPTNLSGNSGKELLSVIASTIEIILNPAKANAFFDERDNISVKKSNYGVTKS